MKTIHYESGNEPPVQDIPKDEKILLERSHHTIKNFIRTQFHYHFSQNDNQGDETKTDVRAPSAECLIGFEPEEFHISDVPFVIFKKNSSSVRWG